MNKQSPFIVGYFPALSIAMSAIFITPFINLEPIHLPRLVLASFLAAVSIFILLTSPNPDHRTRKWFKRNSTLLLLSSFFILCLLVSLLFSGAGIQKQLYGTQGRLNGFLSNLFLILILLGVSLFKLNQNERPWDIAFLIGGGINLLYGYIQLIGWDPINWRNPYGPVIGTFGNPNFMSSFLALFGIYLISTMFFRPKIRTIYKLLLFSTFFSLVYLIIQTKSIQGLFLLFSGLLINVFLFLHMKQRIKILFALMSLTGFLGFVIVAGLMGRGIFGGALFESTLMVRIRYWQTAFNLIEGRPVVGYGMDTFGDWFRAYRPPELVEAYGPNLITNSSHNYALDYGVFGGLPTLSLYIALMFWITLLGLRWIKRNRRITWLFTLFFSGWIAYALQALISIQHLGISIIGMVFGGGIYSLTKSNDIENFRKYKAATPFSQKSLAWVIGGLLVALSLFPFMKDFRFQQALAKNDGNSLILTANRFPQNDFYFVFASAIMYRNDFAEIGRSLAFQALEINPRNYEALKLLSNDAKMSESNLQKFRIEKQRIDPFQP